MNAQGASVKAAMSDNRSLVGVIDSGWDRAVDDERVIPGIGMEWTRANARLTIGRDDRDRAGHGTACGDVILRVAPEARIMPIRVFGNRMETTPELLIAAIRWAADVGLRLVNISAGTFRADCRDELYAACAEAATGGVTIVAAAVYNFGWCHPASFDCVVGVSRGRFRERDRVYYDAEHEVQVQAQGRHRATRGIGATLPLQLGSSLAAAYISGRIAALGPQVASAGPQSVRDALAKMATA
ncbi:MAG: peptidase and in kexin sedolisin [Gemmatimonadetes bacterium]|nr:peptidase and in kexin sedolisin [Gemmatimonadota bacterium]